MEGISRIQHNSGSDRGISDTQDTRPTETINKEMDLTRSINNDVLFSEVCSVKFYCTLIKSIKTPN